MDRLKDWFRPKGSHDEYEPLAEEPRALEGSQILEGQHELPFSWVEYSIFALLGMAMLWAWCVAPPPLPPSQPPSYGLLGHRQGFLGM